MGGWGSLLKPAISSGSASGSDKIASVIIYRFKFCGHGLIALAHTDNVLSEWYNRGKTSETRFNAWIFMS